MDINKSLNQLEGDSASLLSSTELVRRCFEYRTIPIGDLSVEQLRLLIGQNIGLSYLVPLAIRVLIANPLAEGDLYEGDLLMSVLRIKAAYWEDDSISKQGLKAVLALLMKLLHDQPDLVDKRMLRTIDEFKAS